MRSTRLGLSSDVREKAIPILQAALVGTLDLRLSIKQAHWTVRGARFQQLHELFDSFVTPLDEEVDTLAERIATLGGVPDGRATTIGETSGLKTYPKNIVTGDDHLEAMAERFAALGNLARDAIYATDEIGDADTADVFTSLSRFLDQSLWFLEAHISPKIISTKSA